MEQKYPNAGQTVKPCLGCSTGMDPWISYSLQVIEEDRCAETGSTWHLMPFMLSNTIHFRHLRHNEKYSKTAMPRLDFMVASCLPTALGSRTSLFALQNSSLGTFLPWNLGDWWDKNCWTHYWTGKRAVRTFTSNRHIFAGASYNVPCIRTTFAATNLKRAHHWHLFQRELMGFAAVDCQDRHGLHCSRVLSAKRKRLSSINRFKKIK